MSGDKANKFTSSLSLVAVVLAILLAVGFVWAGLAKLVNPFLFLRSVYEYQLIGPPWGRVVALVLPQLELIVGLALLVPSLRRVAATLAVGMCLVFLGAQASVLVRGLDVSCACFGASTDQVGLATMIRSSLFLIASLAVAIPRRQASGLPMPVPA